MPPAIEPFRSFLERNQHVPGVEALYLVAARVRKGPIVIPKHVEESTKANRVAIFDWLERRSRRPSTISSASMDEE